MKRFPVFILLVLALNSCRHVEYPVVNGVTEELAKHRKSVISELTYHLDFRIPAKMTEKVEGSVTIRFQLKNKSQNLQLDFKGDTSRKFTVFCNRTPTELQISNDHLVISKSMLKRGKNEIQIEFTSPDWSLNRNPEYLYTLFVPDRASTAFPCFDQPDLKARFSLQLEIPADWKAVTNGSVVHQTTAGTVKSIRFCTTKPLPTYLFAFTAGKFDTISRARNGKNYVLYHREKEKEILQNNIDSIYNLLFHSIDQVEYYTDIQYPFKKYDLVAIPSFQYSGMEHPGVTYFRASSLFLDTKPTSQQLLKRANLIAHETAHMWFGNLVTMPWFDQVWLKEVFANYMADKVVAPLFPEYDFDLLFLMAHYDAAYSVDRTSGTNAIAQKLDNMKNAGSLYGSIIYHKSPIVMKMLEQKTGKEKLRNGLQQYLRQNAYGNAGWQELIDILNPPKSGELPKWSYSWVNEAGRPTIETTVNGKNLLIEQSDPFRKGRIWPLELDVVFGENGQIFSKKIELNTGSSNQENFFPDEKPDWIYLNASGNAYGYVKFDSVSRDYFLTNLSLLKDDLLRASVLTDLNENLEEGNLSSENFISCLIRQIPKEKNTVIYERMLNYLETCYLYKTTTEQRMTYGCRMEVMIWNEYLSRCAQKPVLMNTLIKLAETKHSLKKLRILLAGDESDYEYVLSTDQQIELALQLGLKMPGQATGLLDAQEKRIVNPDKKEGFQFIRKSVHPEKKDRDRFFNQLLEPENREHEPWVEQAMAFLNHPFRQQESLEYIRPALDELQEIQQTGDIFFPKSWLDNLLKGHSSKEAGEIVRQFLADHPDYPANLKMKILQSADHLLKK
jgi:aminopeptidase N